MADRDDWQVGDLALCVGCEDGLAWTDCDGPAAGAICCVSGMDINPADQELYLALQEWPQNHGYHAIEFRRIRPLSDEEQMLARAEFKADRIINAPVSA